MKSENELLKNHFEGSVIDDPDIDYKIDKKLIYLG